MDKAGDFEEKKARRKEKYLKVFLGLTFTEA